MLQIEAQAAPAPAEPAAEDAPAQELVTEMTLSDSSVAMFQAAPELPAEAEDAPAENGTADKAETKTVVQYVSIRTQEMKDRLLALLGGSEDALPAEAELTRLIHVALEPEDAYGSEEELEIRIYGDFVFYVRHPLDGASTSWRADCSLRQLKDFLKSAENSADASASPAPTADPFADAAANGGEGVILIP